MKKTILILAILLSSITATAQEKQNDATWEETISFIQKYFNKIIHFRMRESYDKCEIYKNDDGGAFTISNKGNISIKSGSKSDYAKEEKYYTDYVKKSTFYLDHLKSVSTFDGRITLCFKKKYRISYEFMERLEGKDVWRELSVKSGCISFGFELKDELPSRMAKAFEHLIYLTKKRKEEERKASGDKF